MVTFPIERSETLLGAEGKLIFAYSMIGNSPYNPWNGGVGFVDARTPGQIGLKNADKPARYTSIVNSSMYQNYRVLGSSIMVQLEGLDGNNTEVQYNVVVHPQQAEDYVAAPTLVQMYDSRQATYAKHKSIPAYIVGESAIATRKDRIIRNRMATHTIYGVPKHAITSSDGYQAQWNTTPADLWYWCVWIFHNQPANPQTFNLAFNITIKLRYYCVLENISSLPSS